MNLAIERPLGIAELPLHLCERRGLIVLSASDQTLDCSDQSVRIVRCVCSCRITKVRLLGLARLTAEISPAI